MTTMAVTTAANIRHWHTGGVCRVLVCPHTPSMAVGGCLVRWCRRYQRTLLNGGRATKTVVDDNVSGLAEGVVGVANGIGKGNAVALGVGDVGRQWFHAWDRRVTERFTSGFFFAVDAIGTVWPNNTSQWKNWKKNWNFFQNVFNFCLTIIIETFNTRQWATL